MVVHMNLGRFVKQPVQFRFAQNLLNYQKKMYKLLIHLIVVHTSKILTVIVFSALTVISPYRISNISLTIKQLGGGGEVNKWL